MPTHWRGSQRRTQLPTNWTTTRVRILTRDGHRCRWPTTAGRCNQPATDVDHIHPGNDHTDTNLWSLCHHHHARKTSREGTTARWTRPTARARRPPEPHPGLT